MGKRIYTEEQKQARREYDKARYLSNRERILARQKAYYEANREEILVYSKDKNLAYYQANRERILEQRKAYREANREKYQEWQRAYNQAHREEKRVSSLQRNLDLTADEYQSMLETQGGVCYICGGSETRVDPRTGEVTALCVDHNHTTGSTRKLLCCGCNFQVGKVETIPGFAESMTDQTKAQMYLDYLEEHA